MTDIQSAFDDGFEAVKAYVDHLEATFAKRLDALERRLSEMPEPCDGEKGDSGQDGRDGVDGEPGPQGVPGKSAYDLAVEHGFTGTVADWLQSLKGEQGQDGIDGKDGAPGERGEKGGDGLNGKDGAPGERGEKGGDGLPSIRDEMSLC
jgi:hypothetical protein